MLIRLAQLDKILSTDGTGSIVSSYHMYVLARTASCQHCFQKLCHQWLCCRCATVAPAVKWQQYGLQYREYFSCDDNTGVYCYPVHSRSGSRAKPPQPATCSIPVLLACILCDNPQWHPHCKHSRFIMIFGVSTVGSLALYACRHWHSHTECTARCGDGTAVTHCVLLQLH